MKETEVVGDDCTLLGTRGGFVAGDPARALDGVPDKQVSISGWTRNLPCLLDEEQ